ncbi:MAG: transposase domain-containing protein, partial [Geminicoccaceae bacterium]
QTYIADLLNRLPDHKINRLDELLPWKWKLQEQKA